VKTFANFFDLNVCLALACAALFLLASERIMDWITTAIKPLLKAQRKAGEAQVRSVYETSFNNWKAAQEASGVKFNEKIPAPLEKVS
jgi:hypothetical protein